MNKVLYTILDNINEGIIIINERQEVIFWNNAIARMTGVNSRQAVNTQIFSILPNLNKDYFKTLISSVMCNGYKMFFSAALHELIPDRQVNLKVSKFCTDESECLLLEIIDVTQEFARISQLQQYVSQLYISNEKLKQQEKVIKKLAYYDELTGVANRTLFYQLADNLLRIAKSNESYLGLLFIDVDKFKSINDRYGHKLGDQVLKEIAQFLQRCTRHNDVVARYGGDEFLVLLSLKKYADYKAIVSRIQGNRARTLFCSGKEVQVSFSMGLSFYPYDGECVDDLIQKADQAMYRMKRQSGDTLPEEY